MEIIYENSSNLTVTSADGKIMTERDLKERVFQRLDQFDYQKFIIDTHWYIEPTIVMLASFYMEVNGLFEQGDPVEAFAKIYSNYTNFVVYGGLLGGHINFTNMDETDDDPDAVNMDSARFRRESLFEYIENNNIIRLDVDLLKRFISGDEKPAAPLSAVMTTYEGKTDTATLIETTPEAVTLPSAPDANTSHKECKYVFRNMNHFWKLIYDGKETLVKDSIGIKYLNYLVMHKHKHIDWAILYNSVQGVDPDYAEPDTAFEYVSEGFNQSEGKIGRIYAGKDIKALKREISVLEENQEEAKELGYDDEVATLQDKIDDIKMYIMNSYRKDGTLKESASDTDKRINGIKTAIKRAIGEIEIGFPEFGKHLTDSIVMKWQRTNPSYSPFIDIEWDL